MTLRIKSADVAGKLTVRKRYLLDRIPSTYNLNGFHAPPEPAAVTQARKLVDRYEKSIAHKRCVHGKRTEALIRKAREAVYFASDDKALAIIRQVEKLLKTCQE
jgi:hypothetical protein